MQLALLDWGIIGAFFVLVTAVGIAVAHTAGKSTAEFFLSGRTMPWWLLGTSMVATTFSSDTPLLVTDIVRRNGVAGNWEWWAFLLTGMLTVFVYAKLWRRSEILTDLEFYEMRYSGKPASFLRGFRAIYLGVFFNVMIMASVTLAAIKIAGVLLGFHPLETILVAIVVTVVFSAAGGLRGVLLTDFILFIVAMVGALAAAFVALAHPKVGGLSNMLSHPAVQAHTSLVPDFSDTSMVLSVLIIPLAVQWWSVWYPGAEPGGGGYIAQRMLAAKTERHAVGATLFFNFAHYALRPWPWIIVALCSLIVFPDLDSLHTAFPNAEKVNHDMAYPAMLTLLPVGLRGLVVASLIAAYMSTISTHLNWGSSYVVNDCYNRFLRPNASQRELVRVGRWSTVLMMVLASIIALWLESAYEAFKILLLIGAGTGLLFILRWFWWRINATTEIVAMIVSFLVALFFTFGGRFGLPELPSGVPMVIGVGITTIAWLVAAFYGPRTSEERLRQFYRHVQPGGPGWRSVVEKARAEGDPVDHADGGWDVPIGVLCMALGCLSVYGALFAMGYLIYGNYVGAGILLVVTVASTVALTRTWKHLRFS
jgi:Na+/proline symporter